MLEAIRLYKKLGIWIEITTLVIPSLNDSEDDLRKIAEFIKDVDEGIPWHVSRFFPAFKLPALPPTPLSTLNKARKIGLESGLRHVYQGNAPGEGENTFCHKCGRLLIERRGYNVRQNNIKESQCPYCGAEINGVWT